MPELPEVETTRRGLAQNIIGRRLMEITVRRRDLRLPLPEHFEARLRGCSIMRVRRRAKYLLLDLDSGEVLLAHLGMSGSFRVLDPTNYAPKTHDHVLFYLSGGRLCVFHDPRRFGLLDLFVGEDEAAHPLLAHLGPEPLGEGFTPGYLATGLARRGGALKPALMDQKLVVGVGNIYASESLHRAGINPMIKANKAVKFADVLVSAVQATLRAALEAGGSTLRDYVGADGTGGYFQHHFLVYDRAGEPCSQCGGTIETMLQAGRASYWCAQCQPIRAIRRKC